MFCLVLLLFSYVIQKHLSQENGRKNQLLDANSVILFHTNLRHFTFSPSQMELYKLIPIREELLLKEFSFSTILFSCQPNNIPIIYLLGSQNFHVIASNQTSTRCKHRCMVTALRKNTIAGLTQG